MKLCLEPTKQKSILRMSRRQKSIRICGTCRFVYNFYIAHNKEVYEQGGKFVTAYDFSKWLNQHIKDNPELSWIKETSSKSIEKTIQSGEMTFKKFFKKQAGYPKFKKKGRNSIGLHFVRASVKHSIKCERHRIKIPTYGFVRLKEKGYIPTNPNTHVIKSGTISYEARTLLCERPSGNSGRADCPY